jgi:uncharacterized protein YndB with AHSA1/START domain
MPDKAPLVLIDRTILIDRPITGVFDFVANHENYALWFPEVISVWSITSEAHGVIGKSYGETVRLPGGRTSTMTIRVVDSHAPVRFVTEGAFPPLQPTMAFHLERVTETSTRARWVFASRARSGLVRWLVKRLIGKTVAVRAAIALPRLKALIEALPDTPTSAPLPRAPAPAAP